VHAVASRTDNGETRGGARTMDGSEEGPVRRFRVVALLGGEFQVPTPLDHHKGHARTNGVAGQ